MEVTHQELVPQAYRDKGSAQLQKRFMPPDRGYAMAGRVLEEVGGSLFRPVVKMFGKESMSRRLQILVGDEGLSYRYSGSSYQAAGWTPTLSELRDDIQGRTCTRFNVVLVNLYVDNADEVDWHCDNERKMGARPTIASLSFGAENDNFIWPHFDALIWPHPHPGSTADRCSQADFSPPFERARVAERSR